jgi:zinc transport system substrate-binding protein
METIAGTVASRLQEIDPNAATSIATNAITFADAMTALDAEFTSGLAHCAITDMVVSHEAFAYLGAAYGLTQVGISGLSPDAEPSPARMKDVAGLVAREAITTIYYETLVDPKVAQTIADETGATAVVLDPLEGLAAGSTADYLSVMRQNLATLEKGQGCT